MVGGQDRCRDFSRREKMPQIRPRISPAHRARALRIDWPLILRIPRILDQHSAFARVQASVPRRTRRQHAIHHVDSERHVVRQLLGPPTPIRYRGLSRGIRKVTTPAISHVTACGSPTASPPTAYPGKSSSSNCRALSCRKSANVAPCTIPNCHCAKSPFCWAYCKKLIPRPPRPLRRPLHRRFGQFPRRRSLDALIQRHRNVRAQRQLHLTAFFRREQCSEPSKCDRNRTPSSVILRNSDKLKT